MKKLFACIAVLGLLCACASAEYPSNTESRSTTWQGQSAEDLYENFGVPTVGFRVSENERHLLYHTDMITRGWTERIYHYCDIMFVLVDEKVVDWSYHGNQCTLNIREAE